MIINQGRGAIIPLIKPISDLRNKANEISDFVHQHDEPVFITKNGEGDLVVISMGHYRKLQKKLELFAKLAVAQSAKAAGEKGRSLSEVMKDIRRIIGDAA
jgi:prevent-host-death family protein